MTELHEFKRDVTQAYTQARSWLERSVYIKAPAEMNLPEDIVLRVIKPLYGIPESGVHWYFTYLDHHLDELQMSRATMDSCLFVKRDHGTLSGLVILHIDHSLAIGAETFIQEGEKTARQFKTKGREQLRDSITTFNGISVTKEHDGTIKMDQKNKIQGLTIPTTNIHFIKIRAKAQYIAVNCRPDCSATTRCL